MDVEDLEGRSAQAVRLRRAREIAGRLGPRAAQADRERRLPQETVDELARAGLLHLLQPARWGGAQAGLQDLLDVQNVLAQECLSTAWVVGVLNVQNFMLALFDERAQHDVWGGQPGALVSSSFLPKGRVTRVDGGFRISGQWPYSSGCAHAQWALVGAMVPPERPDGAAQMRVLLVPRADIEVVDTWHTFGLRGTGSNDLRIDDAFVPLHRTWCPSAGLVPAPEAAAGVPALYRLPWLYVFTSAVASPGIGGARGAVAAYLATLRERLAELGSSARTDTPALQQAARARVELDEIEASLRAGVRRLTRCAAEGESMVPEEGWRHRLLLTSTMRRCAALVDGLVMHGGAGGVFTAHPVTRFWLDLCAARVHPGNDPAGASAELARHLVA